MNKYQQIVESDGKGAADAYMKALRPKDKPAGGLHYVDPEVRKQIMEKVRAGRKHAKDKDRPS